MGSAIGLREDFDGAALRRLSRTTKSANQARRLLALAEIYDGGSRSAAARIGGVGLQIVRDWVIRFNARGPDGLLDGKAPGPRSRLNDAQRQALVDVVESGPIPAIHGVVRWRLIDLAQWLHDEFAVSLDETNISRELKKLGYVKLTARPRHHAQNEHAMEAFKKGASLPSWQRSREPPKGNARRNLVPGRSPRRPEEQDHAALGEARDKALGAKGPADEIGLHLRRHLPGARQGRRAPCPSAIPKPWPCTSPKYHLPSRRVPMPSS
jgi:transposase